jgi:aminobenzoyl-glutamate utilization protein B
MLFNTLGRRFLFGVAAFVCVANLSTPITSLADTEIAKEKKFVLEWLNQPRVIEQFGKISDLIWSYAELGMQEYKSSALLADTLEQVGWSRLRP